MPHLVGYKSASNALDEVMEWGLVILFIECMLLITFLESVVGIVLIGIILAGTAGLLFLWFVFKLRRKMKRLSSADAHVAPSRSRSDGAFRVALQCWAFVWYAVHTYAASNPPRPFLATVDPLLATVDHMRVLGYDCYAKLILHACMHACMLCRRSKGVAGGMGAAFSRLLAQVHREHRGLGHQSAKYSHARCVILLAGSCCRWAAWLSLFVRYLEPSYFPTPLSGTNSHQLGVNLTPFPPPFLSFAPLLPSSQHHTHIRPHARMHAHMHAHSRAHSHAPMPCVQISPADCEPQRWMPAC